MSFAKAFMCDYSFGSCLSFWRIWLVMAFSHGFFFWSLCCVSEQLASPFSSGLSKIEMWGTSRSSPSLGFGVNRQA